VAARRISDQGRPNFSGGRPGRPGAGLARPGRGLELCMTAVLRGGIRSAAHAAAERVFWRRSRSGLSAPQQPRSVVAGSTGPGGGTRERELLRRVAAASPWQPSGAEIAEVSLVPAQTEGRLQLPTLPNRVPAIVEADHSEKGPMWPNVLVPYDEREAISVQVAARKAGKSPRTIRLWGEEHGIGRRIAGGSWKISRVALQMLLDGDRAALDLYQAGNRRHPRVVAYFERLRRGEFA
jgi:hypothetical protein